MTKHAVSRYGRKISKSKALMKFFLQSSEFLIESIFSQDLEQYTKPSNITYSILPEQYIQVHK